MNSKYCIQNIGIHMLCKNSDSACMLLMYVLLSHVFMFLSVVVCTCCHSVCCFVCITRCVIPLIFLSVSFNVSSSVCPSVCVPE